MIKAVRSRTQRLDRDRSQARYISEGERVSGSVPRSPSYICIYAHPYKGKVHPRFTGGQKAKEYHATYCGWKGIRIYAHYSYNENIS